MALPAYTCKHFIGVTILVNTITFVVTSVDVKGAGEYRYNGKYALEAEEHNGHPRYKKPSSHGTQHDRYIYWDNNKWNLRKQSLPLYTNINSDLDKGTWMENEQDTNIVVTLICEGLHFYKL